MKPPKVFFFINRNWLFHSRTYELCLNVKEQNAHTQRVTLLCVYFKGTEVPHHHVDLYHTLTITVQNFHAPIDQFLLSIRVQTDKTDAISEVFPNVFALRSRCGKNFFKNQELFNETIVQNRCDEAQDLAEIQP